ncbi:MAG: TIGR04255 family protein [Phycisphaerales bacterium]|jgi:uncharacterized protein (TIGR04255 family)
MPRVEAGSTPPIAKVEIVREQTKRSLEALFRALLNHLMTAEIQVRELDLSPCNWTRPTLRPDEYFMAPPPVNPGTPVSSLDIHKPFPKLAKDPIVECVIAFVTRVPGEWSASSAKGLLDAVRKDYPQAQELNAARVTFMIPAGPDALPPPEVPKQEDLGWAGWRLVSEDQKQVVTFGRDGVTVARLAPYPGWTALSTEATRLWSLFAEHTGVSSIDRLHVRYINRLVVPGNAFDPIMYFSGFGAPPSGMVRGLFCHQDTLGLQQLPGAFVNVVRTFEAGGITDTEVPLILDLEAMRTEPFPSEAGMIAQRLTEMHTLKNMAFFESVTAAFTDLCR